MLRRCGYDAPHFGTWRSISRSVRRGGILSSQNKRRGSKAIASLPNAQNRQPALLVPWGSGSAMILSPNKEKPHTVNRCDMKSMISVPIGNNEVGFGAPRWNTLHSPNGEVL